MRKQKEKRARKTVSLPLAINDAEPGHGLRGQLELGFEEYLRGHALVFALYSLTPTHQYFALFKKTPNQLFQYCLNNTQL